MRCVERPLQGLQVKVSSYAGVSSPGGVSGALGGGFEGVVGVEETLFERVEYKGRNGEGGGGRRARKGAWC